MDFNLGYKYFQTNATKTFQESWKDQYFSDVTLVSGDENQYRAHKIILSSSSTFFKNIFGKYPYQKHLIILKDIKNKYLQWILEFIYKGHCDVEEPEIAQFLLVGKDLGVKGLLKELVDFDSNITMEDDVSEVTVTTKEGTRFEQRVAIPIYG